LIVGFTGIPSEFHHVNCRLHVSRRDTSSASKMSRNYTQALSDLDEIDVDFDAPMSYEDRELLRQIEEENQQDDDLANDAKNRGALLTSPLLMAVAAAAVTNKTAKRSSSTPTSSIFPPNAPVPVVRPLKLLYDLEEEKREEDHSIHSFADSADMHVAVNGDDLEFGNTRRSYDDKLEMDSMDGEPNENDLHFGSRADSLDGEPNENDLHFGARSDVDSLDGEPNEKDLYFGRQEQAQDQHIAIFNPDFEDNKSEEPNGLRRMCFIVGWIVAVAVLAAAIGIAVTRKKGNAAKGPPPFSPTLASTFMPSQTPFPSNRTPSPTETPTRPEATLKPTVKQTSIPSQLLTRRPTPAPSSSPTISPSQAFITTEPIGTPTKLPSSIIPSPSALTISPTTRTISPTTSPSTKPSVEDLTTAPSSAPVAVATNEPTYTSLEAERRSAITALFIDLSGATVILDTTSSQYMAYQWILNSDPLQLSVVDSPQLVQRYTLATLYFSTNANSTWLSCGSSDGSTDCPTPEQRFLSGSSECQWVGITCEGDVVTAVNLRTFFMWCLTYLALFSLTFFTLFAGENGLNGKLQRELAELSRLSTMIFSRNTLTGTIPTDFGRLSRLRFLLLNRNELGARIPLALGTLASLFYIHLGDNRFTGTAPPEIFVNSLEHLDLGGNALTGTIPESLYTDSLKLINVDLADNNFFGTIPARLDRLTSLRTFTVYNNTLTGTLPGSVFSPKLLSLFDVGLNKLTGGLPAGLFTFGTALTILNLGQNKFSGQISPLFARITPLNQLIFSKNVFTGTIPEAIGQLTNLQVLQTSETMFEGTMPATVCDLRDIGLEVLSSDCAGNPPEVVCNCCTICF
jgi:hypothetical protein